MEPSDDMGPQMTEAEGVVKLVKDRLHDLADAGQPLSQLFGPTWSALSGRCGYEMGSIVDAPPLVVISALEAFVGDIMSSGGGADAGQCGIRHLSKGEEALGHSLVFGTCRCEGKASDNAVRVDRSQQVQTLVETQTIGPAYVGLACKPSPSTALDVSSGYPSSAS